MMEQPQGSDPIVDWNGPEGLPEFARIDEAGFEPAFHRAIAEHQAEIDSIAQNGETPSFANTIDRLELAGQSLSRTAALFYARAGAHTNDTIREVERRIAPVLSRHYTKIAQNRTLFARVDALWRKREHAGYTPEQIKVLEKYRRNFIRAGAALDDAGQARLAAINERLSELGTEFGQNVQADEAEWILIVEDPADVEGLPDHLKNSMAEAARERGHASGYAVTLSRSIIEPFLVFCENRELREIAYSAWIARGEGKRNNWPLIAEILSLRREKAELLGYENYAGLKLEDTMARTPAAVRELLDTVWQKARQKAKDEAADLAGIIAEEGWNHELAPCDWRFYAERQRARLYEISDSHVKPYFQLENVIDAAFDVAGRLFSLQFRPRPEIGAWHPDVRAFEVRDADGRAVGMFLGDYFARSSKRSGAWMSGLQTAHKLEGGQKPIIYNVMNFAKGSPTLLSLDDARTLFHEFGHALHGLLSDVTYPSVSGTSVPRDFVELPSQLYEHWLTTTEILKKHARHYETGEPIPDQLIDRLRKAETFNSGFQTVEYTACALVDMAFHTSGEIDDPKAFEAGVLAEIGMPGEIAMRHRSPHFLHVFAGDGYSAGYYAYMWSEVLDADAFEAFREAGDAFDPGLSARLRENIYATGGSREPETAYIAFRGQMPSAEALMRGRGLE